MVSSSCKYQSWATLNGKIWSSCCGRNALKPKIDGDVKPWSMLSLIQLLTFLVLSLELTVVLTGTVSWIFGMVLTSNCSPSGAKVAEGRSSLTGANKSFSPPASNSTGDATQSCCLAISVLAALFQNLSSWLNHANCCHADGNCSYALLNLVVLKKSSKIIWYCSKTKPVLRFKTNETDGACLRDGLRYTPSLPLASHFGIDLSTARAHFKDGATCTLANFSNLDWVLHGEDGKMLLA